LSQPTADTAHLLALATAIRMTMVAGQKEK